MDRATHARGFLPGFNPLSHFESDSPLSYLDKLGNDLPSLLLESDFRDYARSLKIPDLPKHLSLDEDLPSIWLYFVRLSFIASGYINQVGQPICNTLPANIAIPLVKVASMLHLPPILNYAGYALYNWKFLKVDKQVKLGNIDTIQNFVHLYDEHWFILIHVEIEAEAAPLLSAIDDLTRHDQESHRLKEVEVNFHLQRILDGVRRQVALIKRIPEKMSPQLYFKTFRPYIRFFENVHYEGVKSCAINYRGETGAQSTIMPTLMELLKIPHQPSELINHLLDLRQYMPADHRAYIDNAHKIPDFKSIADPKLFDDLLEAIAQFREVHYGWAKEYIHSQVDDPRGTGGTPYMKWLKQLIDETRMHKHHP